MTWLDFFSSRLGLRLYVKFVCKCRRLSYEAPIVFPNTLCPRVENKQLEFERFEPGQLIQKGNDERTTSACRIGIESVTASFGSAGGPTCQPWLPWAFSSANRKWRKSWKESFRKSSFHFFSPSAVSPACQSASRSQK